ncbi:chromate efflux transporter [Dolichospermum sp. ST_con]|nr:chromate efflux transporter [Dolichospermum sp. ST_con]MDD1419877.1 chromate efflux transporter [Dolichospermum sp. ST_sed1]MDD1423971.1 chromate efflux transporter [Dolichospermum sp. ST_sed9]MDD1430495.1 chromate efflux transporter [Dolichospermum sp. ST_sed6]MDD1437390.1 chromate efflux transporter [Dolichospermum sp. ST_sed10]MDD1439896.1 chromate efflux transporter [Dolichospermum sp. ST_sed3]MDD1445685.1 chromate efflux transporter [Dolichospermum sp. ST_sed8]MDD1454110.1 chromate e
MSNLLSNRLTEVAQLFLKLGIIGFGGPVAHIAMIEDEVVKRRQWLTQEHFLDLLGATNLIPGPNSTEMAIHIGYIYAGWLGLIVAGVCFILPAILITGLLAWVYVNYGTLPQVAPLLYGIKPVVLAIIINAIWGLGKKAIKTRQLLIIAIAVGLITWFTKVNEVIALLLGGILGMIWLRSGNQNNLMIIGLTTTTFLQTTATVNTAINNHISVPLWQLGLFFLKVGSVLFGGGYLLIAFLQGGLVEEYGWLTQQQLLDAIAIGQFTPGPVLSTATFIGYLIAGFPGAIVATLGIFLPSFLFVAALNPLMNRLRNSSWTRPFLDAVNVSAVALMVLTTVQLGIATLILPKTHSVDFLGLGMALISAVLVIRYHINTAYLILGGSMIGYLGYNYLIM